MHGKLITAYFVSLDIFNLWKVLLSVYHAVFDYSMVVFFSADCDISFNMASCNLFLRISASRDLDFAERHTAAILSVSTGLFRMIYISNIHDIINIFD